MNVKDEPGDKDKTEMFDNKYGVLLFGWLTSGRERMHFRTHFDVTFCLSRPEFIYIHMQFHNLRVQVSWIQKYSFTVASQQKVFITVNTGRKIWIFMALNSRLRRLILTPSTNMIYVLFPREPLETDVFYLFGRVAFGFS